MADKELKCSKCGNHFSSEELLREHFKVKHSDSEFVEPEDGSKIADVTSSLNEHVNYSTLAGFLLGVVITSTSIGGAMFLQDMMKEQTDITVVTCSNCSYERFKTVTDRMFDTNYKEVDYESTRGKKLIEKYNLKHIPGFIYEKSIEDRENFTQVRNSLVKFEDAYVMSDEGEEISQRFSEGIRINNQE